MLYWAIFFAVIVLFTLLLTLKIKAAVNYIRNEQDEWVKFSFYLIKGMLHFEYKVPLVKKENDEVKYKLVKGQKREMEGGSEKNTKLMPIDIIKKFTSVINYIKDHGSLLKDIRSYINKKNIHAEIRIKIKQGTGDAAQTGIICGLLWSAAGILTTYVSRHLKVMSKKIDIIPCFNKKIFEVDASCIFHVRLVHIIVVLKKIYYMKFLIRIKTKKAKKTIGGEISG